MRNGYKDRYVLCPLYKCETSNEHRKIHCEGYRTGVFVQLYFKNTSLKRIHKKRYCKNLQAYKTCPLYIAFLEGGKYE